MRTLRRLSARARIARLRAAQAAPVPDGAEPYVVLCHPVPADPETQAALAELVKAAIKAVKEGTLPRNRPPDAL